VRSGEIRIPIRDRNIIDQQEHHSHPLRDSDP
jgi:hypothetical protein